MDHIARSNQLVTLWLTNTAVSNSGLEKLKGLRNLRQISLSGTMVTQEGIDRLKVLLPDIARICWKYGLIEPVPGSAEPEASTGVSSSQILFAPGENVASSGPITFTGADQGF